MKISTKWLKKWLNYDVPLETLVQDLTMGGIEVDCVENMPNLDKVLIGQVLKCEQHPNADKLKVCQVDVNQSETLQIICGASNVRKDLKVAVAMIGAKLPNGLEIKTAELRGELSQGMLCSTDELGFSSQSKGILEIDINQKLGEPINNYLALNDDILELDITPNRGDCFSVLGIARELSVYYKKPLKVLEVKNKIDFDEKIPSSVKNEEACPKYLSRIIKGIDNQKATPQWMVNKLIKAGLGLNSAVVDITNFVMLELGQPTHAFDLSKISELTVRLSNKEKLTLLSEKEVILDDKTLVIADKENVLAIAGVMGGLNSSVTKDTKEVVLESAFFTPKFIAGCARKYGLHTESSLRFERGVDFELQELAIERVTNLIIENLGGQAYELNKEISQKYLPKNNIINFNTQSITEILGLKLENDWIETQLKDLGFIITNKENNNYEVIVPSFRFDVSIVEDLAEELARLYGYDKLPVQQLVNQTSQTTITNNQDIIFAKFINNGYQELINYSFFDKKTALLFKAEKDLVELQNPISQEMAIMRPSLIPGLLKSIDTNKRNGNLDCHFFEVGLCFDGIKKEQQNKKIAGVITGNKTKNTWRTNNIEVNFFDIKEILEDLLKLSNKKFSFAKTQNDIMQKGQTASILVDEKVVGYVGKLSPTIASHFSINESYIFELDFNSLLKTQNHKYNAFSNFQVSKRDLAIGIDNNIEVTEVLRIIQETAQKEQEKILIKVELFDVYQGDNIEKNKRSLAFSLSFQAIDRTLTDNEIETQVENIFNNLNKVFGVSRR
jgi:phenylalanyl-tRNA synthetase beta chain